MFKRNYFKDMWLTVCMLMAYGLTGCVSDEVGGVYLVSQEPESMYPVANHYVEILFQAGGNWTASTSTDWLEVTPSQGSGGRNAVTLRTTSANRTRAERSALLTIVSDGKQESMTIRQSGDYAVFDQDEYVVDAAGGPLTLTFTSNMDRSNLYVSYQKLDWISWSEPNGETRTDWLGRMRELTVSPNPSEDERQAIFVLSTYSRRQELMGLDTTRVRQLGVSAP